MSDKKDKKDKKKSSKKDKKGAKDFQISGPTGPPVLIVAPGGGAGAGGGEPSLTSSDASSASPSAAPSSPRGGSGGSTGGDNGDLAKETKVRAAFEAWAGVGDPPGGAGAESKERKWRQKQKSLQSMGGDEISIGTPESAPGTPSPEGGFAIGRPLSEMQAAQQIQAPVLSKDQRTNVINEIIRTEQDYVRDLNVIVNTYLLGIRNQEKLLAKQDVDLIFSNVEQLLAINTELLRDLEKHFITPEMESQGVVSSAEGVGDAFIRVGQWLKSYTVYCTRQQQATTHLLTLAGKNERLAEILLHYKNTPDARKLDLPSYLIKPVQRICKYPLLLRELIKATPDDHPDLHKLKTAEALIQTVASTINEGKRIAEENDFIFDLQNRIDGAVEIELLAPARKFVRSGPIKQVTADRKIREVFFYLFNDLFIVVEGKPQKDHYTLLCHFPLSNAMIVSEPTDMPSPNAFEIQHIAVSKMILYLNSVDEKEALFEEIAASILRFAKGCPDGTGQARDWRKSVRGKSLPKPPPGARSRSESLGPAAASSSSITSSSASSSPQSPSSSSLQSNTSSPTGSSTPPRPLPRSVPEKPTPSSPSSTTASSPALARRDSSPTAISRPTPTPSPSRSVPPTPPKGPTPPPPPAASKPSVPTPPRPVSSSSATPIHSPTPSTPSKPSTPTPPRPVSTSSATPIHSSTTPSPAAASGGDFGSCKSCNFKFVKAGQKFCSQCGTLSTTPATTAAPAPAAAASDCCAACKAPYKTPTQKYCSRCGRARGT